MTVHHMVCKSPLHAEIIAEERGWTILSMSDLEDDLGIHVQYAQDALISAQLDTTED